MDGPQSTSGGGGKRSAEEAAIGAPDDAAAAVGGDGHKRPRTAHGQAHNNNTGGNGGIANGPGGACAANGASTNGTAGRVPAAVGNGEVKVEDGQATGTAQRDDDGDEEDATADHSSSSSAAAAANGTAPADAPTSAPASALAPPPTAPAAPSAPGQSTSEPARWRAHRMAEDYVGMASSLILPTIRLGPYGYDASSGLLPAERVTALGLLTSPVRRPTVVERWNPYEICVFEASMALYGKDFHEVARTVGTKTCKEVVEFYYVWKKTEHYKVWKREYTPHLESDEED
mmetsp:Transcript_16918/g.48611  ORF Transcript_16918/g.48611 Transcript_16918/m.48611 type:complete len:288 (+) Transcript_16918:99-962(+)